MPKLQIPKKRAKLEILGCTMSSSFSKLKNPNPQKINRQWDTNYSYKWEGILNLARYYSEEPSENQPINCALKIRAKKKKINWSRRENLIRQKKNTYGLYCLARYICVKLHSANLSSRKYYLHHCMSDIKKYSVKTAIKTFKLLPLDLCSWSGEHVGRPQEEPLQTSEDYTSKHSEKMQYGKSEISISANISRWGAVQRAAGLGSCVRNSSSTRRMK